MSLASKYVGILNQGSTCYLNSVIQTLYHLPCFRRKIFELKPKETNSVLVALRNLFAELAAGHRNITTTELTDAFGWSASEAAVQHDVHELIQQLFDNLETLVKGTPDETFVRDIFSGLLIYRSRATDGVDYVSDRLENFYDLELVVENKASIGDSLKALTSPEKIDEVSIEVTPGAAPTKHNIERSLGLLKLPPVLLVHPNRVGFDMETFEPITLSNQWTFNTDLDLAPYMVDERGLKLDKESTEKKSTFDASSTARIAVDSTYELRSVLVHAGDATIGHYYIYVRFDNDAWVCFNDDLVEMATVEDVAKAAFGGQRDRGIGGRYRPFGSERASLLVYVNTACAADVLTETPASEEVLRLAKRIEEERNERWNTTTISYYLGDETYVDILDGVPEAAEKLTRSVKLQGQQTEKDLRAALAHALGAPSWANITLGSSVVRLNYATMRYLVEVVPNALREKREKVEMAIAGGATRLDADAHLCNLFGFFRVYDRSGNLSTPTVFHSGTELHHLVDPREGTLCSYVASNKALMVVEAFEKMTWGGNFIFVKNGANVELLKAKLAERQYRKTDVILVDRMNRAAMERLFSITVADTTGYTALQGGVFDVCKRNASLAKRLPRSSKYIGFFGYDAYTMKPIEVLAPMRTRNRVDGSLEEVTQAMLCGAAKERKLHAAFLPIPMETINARVLVVFRLGWAEMPMVYFTWEQRQLTFGQILQIAFEQLGDLVPSPLRKRYRDMLANPTSTTSTVARLLQVEDGKIINSTQSLSMKVSLGEVDSVFVIDPLPICLPGFSGADVYFCSRRRGEDYFGYPTSIVVSAKMEETGSTLLLRIAKKLGVPNAEEAIKRWMLYVKKHKAKTMKLCEAKATLAECVKALGEGSLEFLVDRPVAPELDGPGATEFKPEEGGGIVIKAASTTDLSAL